MFSNKVMTHIINNLYSHPFGRETNYYYIINDNVYDARDLGVEEETVEDFYQTLVI